MTLVPWSQKPELAVPLRTRFDSSSLVEHIAPVAVLRGKAARGDTGASHVGTEFHRLEMASARVLAVAVSSFGSYSSGLTVRPEADCH